MQKYEYLAVYILRPAIKRIRCRKISEKVILTLCGFMKKVYLCRRFSKKSIINYLLIIRHV